MGLLPHGDYKINATPYNCPILDGLLEPGLRVPDSWG